MSRVAELIFKADNRSAVRALKEISDQSTKTTETLKGDSDEQTAAMAKTREASASLRESMVGLMGFVGIGGVAFGLRDLKDSAVALQANQSQLDAALASTKSIAAGAGDELKAYAEALSTRGGFGTVENLQALTQFVRETKSATEAQKLLTLSTNIARGRGIELASAQQVVARAYTGNVGRLQQLLGPMVAAREAQVGLTLAHQNQIHTLQDEAQMMGPMGQIWLREQESLHHITAEQAALAQMTDKHATAQKVLAAATEAFSGATSRYSRTTEGQLSNLGNTLHNLTESLGTALLPAMDALIHAGAAVAEVMARNKTAVLVAAGAVTLLGGAWGIVKGAQLVWAASTEVGVGVAKALGASVDELTGEVTFASGAFDFLGASAASAWAAATLGLTVLIPAVIFGVVEIVRHWRTVETAVVGVWHHITAAARDALHWIENAVRNTVNEVTRLFHSVTGFFSHPLGSIGLSTGGMVPKYLASGGPSGTDTIPAWLTPGEGVVNTRGMQLIGGQQGLQSINSGNPGLMGTLGMGGNMTITPGETVLRLDGREVANAVTRYVLSRAARGPSSLVGGSLVTGAPGFSS